MRQICKTAFMGSGCRGCSAQQTLNLHKRLDEALIALSGLQQCGLGPDTASKEEFADAKAELKDAVADIACAFGFRLKGDEFPSEAKMGEMEARTVKKSPKRKKKAPRRRVFNPGPRWDESVHPDPTDCKWNK